MDKQDFTRKKSFCDLSEDEQKFLTLSNDPVNRPNLLARLQELGLLSEFLAAESGTIQ